MISIHRKCLEQFKQDAQVQLPNEACGILAGKDGVISHYIAMTNIDQSPEHFSFDMAEAFKVQKQLRKDNLEYLAVIHSHPKTPARPSIEDIALAYDSTKFYLILSLLKDGGGCQAWKIFSSDLERGKVVEYIPLSIID